MRVTKFDVQVGAVIQPKELGDRAYYKWCARNILHEESAYTTQKLVCKTALRKNCTEFCSKQNPTLYKMDRSFRPPCMSEYNARCKSCDLTTSNQSHTQSQKHNMLTASHKRLNTILPQNPQKPMKNHIVCFLETDKT